MKKKLLLLLSLFVGISAVAGEIKQSFDDRPSLGYNEFAVPEGWWYSTSSTSNITWEAGGGCNFSGTPDWGPCMKGGNPVSDRFGTNYKYATLITEAKGGENAYISFWLKGAPKSASRLFVMKMNKTGEGTFEEGEILQSYESSDALKELGLNDNTFVQIRQDIAEDCYIGIKFNTFYLDAYLNSYPGGGGTEPGPTPEPEPEPGNLNTITQNFNVAGPAGFASYELTDKNLPSGWYLADVPESATGGPNIYNGGFYETGGNAPTTDGKSGYLLIGSSAPMTLVTQAKGSTQNASISFDLKGRFGSGSAQLHKMIQGEDGSFTRGDMLVDFTGKFNDSGWTTVTYEGPTEDCFVGLYCRNIYVDNFVNKYEEAADAPKYRVSGMVSCDGNIVEGASVTLSGYEAVMTDAAGAFVFENVAEGSYMLSCVASGCEPYSQDLAVTGDMDNVRVSLTSTTSVMFGIIMDASNNSPISFASVKLYDTKRDENDKVVAADVIANILTDSDGNYELVVKGELNPDGYIINIEAPYFTSIEQPVMTEYTNGYGYFLYGQKKQRNYLMSGAKLSYTATVTGAGDAPVAGAVVTIATSDEPDLFMTATEGADGVYTVMNIDAKSTEGKTYVVSVEAAGYKNFTKEFKFDGNNVDDTITLSTYAPTTFKGTVTDAEGTPLQAEVVLVNDVTQTEVGMKSTDTDGNYEIILPGMLAEAYTLKVTSEYYEDGSVSIANPVRESLVVNNVKLEKAYYVFEARVNNEEGEAISGAKVTFGDEELAADGDVYAAKVWSKDAQGVKYAVKAEAEYYESDEVEFSFTSDKYEHIFVLAPVVYTYTATVKDATDQLVISNATVSVKAGESTVDVENNNDGTYSFDVTALESAGLTYTVTVTAPDYKEAGDTFTFADGSVTQEFRLEKVTSINNVLNNADGVVSVSGKLYIKGAARIFTIDGKLVKVVDNTDAAEVELPAGLYIVAGQKVLVK